MSKKVLAAKLTKEDIQKFRRVVRGHCKKHGRKLPWRETTDPYHILVSEVMLQQTQVERVIPKYLAFLKAFPTSQALSKAPLGDVLRIWSGLGYNRRAQLLQKCAQDIIKDHKGAFPRTQKELEKLSGIGPYTAGALMTFAFDTPVVIIETNIRAVYLHHFYTDKKDISDKALLSFIEQTLDTKHPRLWYNMLMDYGSYIKQTHGNPNRKSAHYVVQKKFEGSNRQVRGKILRALTESLCTTVTLAKKLALKKKVLEEQLQKLKKEGLVVCEKGKWQLP